MIYEIYSPKNYHLENYSKIVEKTSGEQSEGYQFWRDFSAEFAKMHPDWKKIRSGVNTALDAEPKHGELCWTIFERPPG